MMAGQHQSHARWFLDEPLDLHWRQLALCNRRLDLPWVADEEPDRVSRVEMSTLCGSCPVIGRCAEFGLTQPGGFYAGVWTPWQEGGRRRFDDECTEVDGPDFKLRGRRVSARNALRQVLDSATNGVPAETPRIERHAIPFPVPQPEQRPLASPARPAAERPPGLSRTSRR
jgi:hypothetical protein